MKKTNATSDVRKHLKRRKSITQLQALELYGTWRLSAIIYNLRKEMKIESKDVKVKTRYGITTFVSKYIVK